MKRIRRISLTALLVSFALPGMANWAWIPSHEALIESADALVVGTATAVHAVVIQDRIEYTAEVAVSEVLWGTPSPGSRIAVVWTNGVGVVCPRLDRDLLPGIKAFWWLKARGAEFEAPSARSVTPLSDAQSIVSELSKLAAPTDRTRAVLERARVASPSRSQIPQP
jgi:hypothetical protein